MNLSSIKPQRSFQFSTAIMYLLGIVGFGLLIFFVSGIVQNFFKLKGTSALAVTVINGTAEVYIDDVSLGTTPIDAKDIKSGEHKVTLKNDKNSYEVTLNFIPNAQIVLNRDLGVSPVFSAGQNFWLEESNDSLLSVISEPEGAAVFIDNAEVGKTPYSSSSLTAGEYDLRVEKAGYDAQAARISIQDGYRLNVSTSLFPIPAPISAVLIPDTSNLYDLSSSIPIINSDTAQWLEALLYWNESRGINLAGLGVNKDRVFDFFIDYKGNIFDASGKSLTTEQFQAMEKKDKGGYLGKALDKKLSLEAADVYSTSGSITPGAKKVKILETGEGWLRLRNAPSGTEIGKVDVGREFELLEEGTGWYKIKVSSSLEGWVSATYAEVL